MAGTDVDNDLFYNDYESDNQATTEIISGFRDLPLKPELLRAIEDCGFLNPSEVQNECLPQAIQGMDILCQAQSCTGKTAVYLLATLQQLKPITGQVSVLVLIHNGDLAYMISNEYERLSKYMPSVKVTMLRGGCPIWMQSQMLMESYPHIVVGTPGRILALVTRKDLVLRHVKHLVVDECYKIFEELEFGKDFEKIFYMTPREKQVMMFSSTLSEETRQVCHQFMQDPIETTANDDLMLTLRGPQQFYVKLQEHQKDRKLFDLLGVLNFYKIIIFVKSIERCNALAQRLVLYNFSAVAVHRSMSPEERLSRYQQFKDFQCRILVATRGFGRGIHVAGVNIAFNYDMPKNYNTYLNRVALAGRFGNQGLAISFVCNEEDDKLLHGAQDICDVNARELTDDIDISSCFVQTW